MGKSKVSKLLIFLLFLVPITFPFFTVSFLDYRRDVIQIHSESRSHIERPVLTSNSNGNSNSNRPLPQNHHMSPPDSSKSTCNVCLTQDCITHTAASLARAYPDKTNRSAWIITSKTGYESNNSTCAGIIYVKNFKAASSTAAGIALRIAYRYGLQDEHAWVKFSHVRGFKYAQRDRPHSILITSLRDPAARAISRIFYTAITQKGEQPTDENILQKLRWNHRQYGAVSHQGGGYQVRYCSMHKDLNVSWSPEQPNLVLDPQQVKRNVQEIIQAYDFIMVAEQMDESVVALAMILDLPLGDLLVMDAKQNVGQEYLYFSTHDRKKQGRIETCRLSVKAFRSPAIQSHLESTEWYAKNYGDYLLHSAAIQSLNLTIARLGQERFYSMLQEYQRLKSKARQQCANETLSHCSNEGKLQRHLSEQNCYSDDSGCGHVCIDRFLATEIL